MTRINKAFLFLFFLPGIALGQFNLSEITSPKNVNLSSDSLELMNDYFHRLVDEKKLGGIQTAIIRSDSLIHFDSYGYSDVDAKKPLDDQSIFRIFSMTKPMTTVALLQLYEQGKFRLDDPVGMYIKEFETVYVLKDSILVLAKNKLKIIDLLRHTSGYNYGNSRDDVLRKYYIDAALYSSKSSKEFVTKLSKVPLQFEPGTDWQYGLSTDICGYLIEVLSGMSLDKYFRENICRPLVMKDTYFQLPKRKIPQLTVGYGWNEDVGLFVEEEPVNSRFVNEVTIFNAGGGLVSTTFDYLRFCSMILNQGELHGVRILKKETIELMLTDHLVETREAQSERLRLPHGEASFGLGFAIRGSSPENLENVFGWGGAVGTYFKIDTDRDMAYVMMIQLSPHRHLELRRHFQEYVASAIIE